MAVILSGFGILAASSAGGAGLSHISSIQPHCDVATIHSVVASTESVRNPNSLAGVQFLTTQDRVMTTTAFGPAVTSGEPDTIGTDVSCTSHTLTLKGFVQPATSKDHPGPLWRPRVVVHMTPLVPNFTFISEWTAPDGVQHFPANYRAEFQGKLRETRADMLWPILASLENGKIALMADVKAPDNPAQEFYAVPWLGPEIDKSSADKRRPLLH